MIEGPQRNSVRDIPKIIGPSQGSRCRNRRKLRVRKDFYFAGSNAYYFPFGNNEIDVELGMKAATKAGLKVFRTWSFYDKNYGGEGAGPSEVYFQSWDDGKPPINYGPTGLQAFDKAVRAAEKTGIKLVVALDYGGLDVYTVNLGGKYHGDFYHVPKIVNAYKNYIQMRSDNVGNLSRSADCVHNRMTAWVKHISAYIKKLDPCHLVSTGGEGEFNFLDRTDDWAYSSADGGDFYGELSLPTSTTAPSTSTPTGGARPPPGDPNKAGKPVVFEEYGWLSPEKRLEYLGKNTIEYRIPVVSEWQRTAVEKKLAGTQYWQYGYDGYSYGRNWDDGFTIYLENKEEADVLVVNHAKDMDALNRKSEWQWW
ncbi:mannan endo-1,4-beta-mannosidase [Tirmania nivea]|nr:mannan endo-1,4-beta-mannosidase [Tirmania nivea]